MNSGENYLIRKYNYLFISINLRISDSQKSILGERITEKERGLEKDGYRLFDSVFVYSLGSGKVIEFRKGKKKAKTFNVDNKAVMIEMDSEMNEK